MVKNMVASLVQPVLFAEQTTTKKNGWRFLGSHYFSQAFDKNGGITATRQIKRQLHLVSLWMQLIIGRHRGKSCRMNSRFANTFGEKAVAGILDANFPQLDFFFL